MRLLSIAFRLQQFEIVAGPNAHGDIWAESARVCASYAPIPSLRLVSSSAREPPSPRETSTPPQLYGLPQIPVQKCSISDPHSYHPSNPRALPPGSKDL